MFSAAPDNPKVPVFLRLVTATECVVVFATAFVLFFLPDLGREIWAWSAPPFNSRFIGAIYFAALLPLVVFAVIARWSPGRLVLWMIFAFTTSIMIAMLIHWNDFEWPRPATWGFWFLYLFIPANSVVHLYLLRNLQQPDLESAPTGWGYVLVAAAAALALYSLGLMLAPETVTAFWPWTVDAFHGRIYTATYITAAVGAWLIRQKGSPSEYFLLGGTLATLGVFSIAGVLLAHLTVPPARQVNFSAVSTWAYFALNVIMAAVGGGLMWLGRSLVRQTGAAPAGLQRPAHLRPVPAPVADKRPRTSETIEIRPGAGVKPFAPETMTVAAGVRYRFQFADGREIVLRGGKEYFVGRADPARNWNPAADLSSFGGEQQGVSRQHARIFAKGVMPFIEDLGSHNGTFVNDQRLEANHPVPIKNNDRVQFGVMSARFYLEAG